MTDDLRFSPTTFLVLDNNWHTPLLTKNIFKFHLSPCIMLSDHGKGSSGRGSVTQAKACDVCCRSKLKCVGREDPPCELLRMLVSNVHLTGDGNRNGSGARVEGLMDDTCAIY